MSYKEDLPEDIAQAMELFRSKTRVERGYTLTDGQIIEAALRKFLLHHLPNARRKLELEESGADHPVLMKRFDEVFDLSNRTANVLGRAGVVTVMDLVLLTETKALRIKNFGRKSFNEVQANLMDAGLHFGMRFKELPPPQQAEVVAIKK